MKKLLLFVSYLICFMSVGELAFGQQSEEQVFRTTERLPEFRGNLDSFFVANLQPIPPDLVKEECTKGFWILIVSSDRKTVKPELRLWSKIDGVDAIMKSALLKTAGLWEPGYNGRNAVTSKILVKIEWCVENGKSVVKTSLDQGHE